MKTKVYIDFDGTLYNSDNFYNSFIEICSKYNIKKEKVKEIENDIFNNKNLFNVDILSQKIFEYYQLPINFLYDVEVLYKEPNLFSDTIPSLEQLIKSSKYELYILTHGNREYQLKKITSSKIDKYIKEIIVTTGSKIDLDGINYQKSIFIDNNPFQIKQLIAAKAKKVIRIRRHQDKYSKIASMVPVNEYDNLLTLIKEELL